MHRIFVVLFYIIFAVGIKGAWIELSTSIDEDAVELTQLTETFWSLKPAVFQKKGPLVLCQFIDECCTTENRLQAISSMVYSIVHEYRNKNRYNQVINKCISSIDSKEVNQSCLSLNKLLFPIITEQDKSMIKQHRKIIMNYFLELNNLVTYVNEKCNNEEIHALLCSSNTKLVKTCASKILQVIYNEDGYEIYQEFLTKTKQILVDLNQRLKKNTNSE